jgi:hypothetical protein
MSGTFEAVNRQADVESAYNPLLAIAQQLHRTNPDEARRHLIELEAANSFRTNATRLRAYLGQ